MQFRKLLWPMLVVALLIGLAACGGDDEGGGDVNLSQTLTAESSGLGSFTVHYPEGWVGEASGGGINMASSQAMMDQLNTVQTQTEALAEDEAAATAMLYPAIGAEAGTLSDVVSTFADSLTGEGAGTTADLGDVEEFETNGKSAVLISGTITENDISNGAILVAVTLDGATGILIFVTNPDQVNDYKATARAMAGQFEFTASQ